MWAPTILWFGSLKSGYDDYTAGLFERETGIAVPVEPLDPERFRKRSEFLLGEHRETWIRWRCEKIAAFLLKIRDAMIAERPDLTPFADDVERAVRPGGLRREYPRLPVREPRKL